MNAKDPTGIIHKQHACSQAPHFILKCGLRLLRKEAAQTVSTRKRITCIWCAAGTYTSRIVATK